MQTDISHIPLEERYLTVAEVAAWTTLSMDTLNKWRCNGYGPKFSKIGHRVAYRAGDVQAFLAANSRVIDGESKPLAEVIQLKA